MRHAPLVATLALASLMLGACVSTGPHANGPVAPVVASPGNAPQPHPLARSATYTCEDLTSVALTEGQPDAYATLNSGMTLRLQGQGAGRFGAAPYEFRAFGSEGTWVNQGRANRCRVK